MATGPRETPTRPLGPVSPHGETVASGEPPTPVDALPRGTPIGRYLTLRVIGEGGMGVVYGAYDPELDRRIAIKVLRFADDEADGTAGRARMQREAQALARLSHPNVIAIFDVGPFAGGLFLAMELVEGGTLRTWRPERPWRDVVDAYVAAGRGLAAAHAAGLVHRDFKPDNVLVGRDGRFRVTDFGLVRAAGDPGGAPEAEPSLPPTPRGRALDSALTQAGSVMGTLHYMAPEQLAGAPADARSDQFAFCVALWEALAGERPYAGDDALVLRGVMDAGERRPAPAGSPVPARVWRALERGLAVEPDARWPAVPDLLAELDAAVAPPARRPSRVVPVGLTAAVAVGGLVVAALGLRGDGDRACAAAGAPADVAWDDAARARVRAAFDATGAPYAADAFAAVDAALAGWVARWKDGAAAACADVRAAPQAAAVAGALRQRCLDTRLDRVAAWIDALGASDADAVARAPGAAARLPDLAVCADAAALAGPEPPPDPRADPDRRARADAAAAAVATLAARAALADAADARALLPEAAAAVDAAREARWSPGLGEALLVHGTLAGLAGDGPLARKSLVEAIGAALAGRDDELAARALVEIAEVEREVNAALPDAERWATLALGAAERVADPARQRVRARRELGRALGAQSRLADARRELTRALEEAEAAYGAASNVAVALVADLAQNAVDDGAWDEAEGWVDRALPVARAELGEHHPRVASLLHTAGTVAYWRGRPDDAIARYAEAVAIRRALPGARRELGSSVGALGTALLAVGRVDDAEAHLRESVALAEAEYGPDHAEVAAALSELGGALRRRGDHAGALDVNLRALAIRERAFGPDHPEVAISLVNVALESKALGRMEEVEARYRRALAIFVAARGDDSFEAAITWLNLGEVLRVTGKLAAAGEAYASAERAVAAALGPEHGVMAHVWSGQGQLALAGGRRADAIPLLERAIAAWEREGDGADPKALGEARAALAAAREPR